MSCGNCLKILFVYIYFTDGYWWARVFKNGWGVHYRNVMKHGLFFSERIGATKQLAIGKHVFTILKPSTLC